MATDLAATVANTASPVVTSASYTFLARDVGHFLYVKTGTNWTAGAYPIASVSAGAATLNAAVGAAVVNGIPSTVAGCATVASPSSGTWSIDYSQKTTAGIAYTDMLIAVTTTNYTSVLNPVGKNLVGNVISVVSGVNATVQRVQVVSVSGTTATCDVSLGTAAAVATGNLGGCLASPGKAGGLMIAGNTLYLKAGTYTVTSTSSNVAVGCPSLPAGTGATVTTRLIGYNSVRGDYGTKPLIKADGVITTFTLLTCGAGTRIENVSVDGNSRTSSRGISATAGLVIFCKLANCTNNGLLGTGSTTAEFCEATGCATNPALHACARYYACTAHDNTVTGFGNVGGNVVKCISCNNTGASSDGFVTPSAGAGMLFEDCKAYGNGRHGYWLTQQTSQTDFFNCEAVNNAGYGFNPNGVYTNCFLYHCAGYNNTSGDTNTTNLAASQLFSFITLTAAPYVNAGGNDFSPNANAGGGAALRATGVPGATAGIYQLPGLSTLSYGDTGGVQHQDLPGALFAL